MHHISRGDQVLSLTIAGLLAAMGEDAVFAGLA